MTRITGTLHEDLPYVDIFMTIIFLRMRNASDKRKKKKEMSNNRFAKIVPFMR
jgi:hypothetical protein